MGASGTTTIDFGAFPGASDASVAVTGQAAILGSSLVEAWLYPLATADHSADEHMVETIKVFADASTIVAAVGFTIRAFNTSEISERERAQFYEHGNPIAGSPRASRHQATYSEGKGTRIYGVWTVAWVWN